MSDRLLTLRDAQAVLAVSRQLLWKLIGDGTLPTVRVGGGRTGKRWVRESDLEAFIAGLVPAQVDEATRRLKQRAQAARKERAE